MQNSTIIKIVKDKVTKYSMTTELFKKEAEHKAASTDKFLVSKPVSEL